MNAKSEQDVAQASRSFADWGILRFEAEPAGKDDQPRGIAGQVQIEFLEGLDVIRLAEKGQQDGEAFGNAVYAFGGLKGVDEFNNKLKLLGAFRDGKEMDELQVIRKKLPMRFAVPAGAPVAAEPARDFDDRAPANFFLELPAGGGRRDLAANKPVDLRQLVDAGRRWNKQKDALNWEESARQAKSLHELMEQYRFPVREYAHQHSEGDPGVRSDFAETVFWHPLLIADASGRAEVKFDLSDSVTTYRVLVDAHDGHGRIGGGKGEVISRIPFNLEPKIPLEVTAGDRIEMPVAVTNDIKSELPVQLSLAASDLFRLRGTPHREIKLAADSRGREYFSLDVVGQSGQGDLEVRGAAGGPSPRTPLPQGARGVFSDAKRQAIAVVPPGFPISQSYAGKIDGEQNLALRLPDDWVPGSLHVTISAFPSSLADLQKGIDSILREPGGCFEQASSLNYPNIMVLTYMKEHDVANPELTRRAKGMLTSGYKLLTGYECPQKGYEWFGGDPGHEALSAYGLMEFRDMSQVFDVDSQMIDRTAAWLMKRRDGKGGFQRNPRAL